MATTGKTAACLVAALVVVRLVVVGIALEGAATGGHKTVLPGDVRRYHKIAAGRGVPYRDFAVEYPPLTLAAVDALDGRTVRDTTVRLMWSQLVLDVAVAAVLAWGWGRKAAVLYLVLGLAFLWYPFLYLRLDLLSVLLAVGGLALVRRRRTVAGASTIAIACFAKVWPVALAPLFVVRRSARGLLAFVLAGIAGLAAWVAVGGIDGPVQVLTFRGADGWQIESTFGALVHTFGTARAHIEEGAMRAGVVPDWARVVLPLAGFLLVVGVWVLAGRTRSLEARVLDGLAPLGAVAALLVTATVLSPQYVSWLLPFAAIAAAGGERAVAWLTAAVGGLSTLGLDLVKELNAGEGFPAAVVLVRNLLLVTLLVVVVVRLVRSRPERPRPEPIAVAHPARPPVEYRLPAGVPGA
jgi:hypothetical protein